jgi:hypothetical protein
MSTAITAVGTSEWLLLVSHGMRFTGHSGAALCDRLSRTAVVCSVLVEAWAPSSGKNLLSYFEWCLVALFTRLFQPPGRVGLVWERGRVRALHLDPLEIVDGGGRWLSGCTRCAKNRQELHADSLLAIRAPV